MSRHIFLFILFFFGFSFPAHSLTKQIPGDFNGDGFSDLAIGVPFEEPHSTGDCNSGAVQVLHGGANGLQAASPDDQLWTQDEPGVPGN